MPKKAIIVSFLFFLILCAIEADELEDSPQPRYRFIGCHIVGGQMEHERMPFGITYADSVFFNKSLMYISADYGGPIKGWGSKEFGWICGVSISVTEKLRIPVGVGGNHFSGTSEVSTFTGTGAIIRTEHIQHDWQHSLAIEAGLQPVIHEKLVFTAACRLVGFSKIKLVVGLGVLF